MNWYWSEGQLYNFGEKYSIFSPNNVKNQENFKEIKTSSINLQTLHVTSWYYLFWSLLMKIHNVHAYRMSEQTNLICKVFGSNTMTLDFKFFKKYCENFIANTQASDISASGSVTKSCKYICLLVYVYKWNLYQSEFHYARGHVNTGNEVTSHWSEILPQSEISNQFEFTLGLM